MRYPEWYQALPTEIKGVFSKFKEKVDELVKQYGDLKRYGKSPIESKEELAILYYLAKEVSYRELAKFLHMDKTTIYRLVKRIEEKNEVILNGEKIAVTPDELKEIVKDMMKPKARKWLKSVQDSATIQEFISNPVKRQKASKHGMFYTKSQVKKTVKKVNELAIFITRNKDLIEKITKMEATNNPDLWTEEFLRRVIDIYCAQKHTDSFKQLVCKRSIKQLLRRIPRWRDYFAGEIGTVRNVIRPKESTLYLEHYYKLKKLAQESDDPEFKAFYLIASLHIWSGVREGYGSIKNKLERMEAQGLKLRIKGLGDIDLDDDIVDTSLIGIKWSNAKWNPDGSLAGFEIYEEKTKKWWNLSINWLDNDITKLLEEVYYKTARPRNINSVIKSILIHYRVKPPKNHKWSVEQFKRWYKKWVKQLKEILGLPWEMNPHRLRSAHIAILAELRIPMEMALSNVGFGVGWEDATTALIFYLRFSRTLLQDYITQANEIKQRILQQAT